MTTAKTIRLGSRPSGAASHDNFELTRDVIPDPGEGQFLVRILWLSLDPYMRGRMNAGKSYTPPVAVGEAMTAQAVGQVVATRHSDFVEGDIVLGQFGWTDHALSDGEGVVKVPEGPPISTALGVLGMPGFTAWTGLGEITGATRGETILVSAATGAVGAVAGQLARLRGLRSIGVAGGAEKCAFAVEELGYDDCLDHRTQDAASLTKAVEKAAPGGLDIYFENVGGDTLHAAIMNMKDFGRIALCGMVAWYQGANIAEAAPLPLVWRNILTRRLRVRGFIIFDHYADFPAFHAEVAPMVMDGRIKVREDVTEGLENAPDAFFRMLDGGNLGKTLVKVADL